MMRGNCRWRKVGNVVSSNGSPFYVPGEIVVPVTDDKVGKFHCWGFFYDGGASGVVCQEYDLTGRGKIQVQGVEDDGPRAVTGGKQVVDCTYGL